MPQPKTGECEIQYSRIFILSHSNVTLFFCTDHIRWNFFVRKKNHGTEILRLTEKNVLVLTITNWYNYPYMRISVTIKIIESDRIGFSTHTHDDDNDLFVYLTNEIDQGYIMK